MKEFPNDRPPGGPPPTPSNKRRGRPPGAKNKPKALPGSDVERAGEPARLAAWLDESPEESPAPVRPPAVETKAPNEPTPLDAEIQRFGDELDALDFRSFGTKPRFGVFVVRDISPSEEPHEEEWEAGSRMIPVEIRKHVAARNLIDVAMFTGAEDFRFLTAAHGKDFALPPESVQYGTSTFAVPWLRGIRAAVEAYRGRLRAQRVDMSEALVAIASDYQFGDDFRGELAAFKGWAKANRVTVVPAGFGKWLPNIAAEFGLGEVSPVDLKDISFSRFFRVLSQSAVSASQARPGTSTAKILNAGFKAGLPSSNE